MQASKSHSDPIHRKQFGRTSEWRRHHPLDYSHPRSLKAEVNTKRCVPSPGAIAGAKLQRDVLVAKGIAVAFGLPNLAAREPLERQLCHLCVSDPSSSAPSIEAQPISLS